ncbi:hypothetical protein GNP82_09915 [Aliivibrio fischeri]|uniref:hypothetical protein n=1 Tax=Aliivibrio fischeri TaxID=668 RepID=UPI0012D8951D|nr:hypothetical protein [Aliivibrio fischeri]MUK37867.1 hypothetical protein [Aliivibrio fischeri]MUL07126.1 hypothetical protein [Aliivibrio fischeri]
MRAEIFGDKLVLIYVSEAGKDIKTSLSDSILGLNDWNILINHMIAYCDGKRSKSKKSWLGRINLTLSSAIKSLSLKKLPVSSQDWEFFIKQWYVDTITSTALKSSISTRVTIWNKNVKPFLEFIKCRDVIPLDVVIPKMKRVGEVKTNSSFNISLIGESPPQVVDEQISENKFTRINLLTPISLSRTDSEYLDEVRFDLERKRDSLLRCLINYWKTVKSFYDFGSDIAITLPKEYPELVDRMDVGDIYDFTKRPGKRVPPIRRHIAMPDNKIGFKLYLYTIHSKLNGISKSSLLRSIGLPDRKQTPAMFEKKMKGNYFFPETQLESDNYIASLDKLDWCMGVFNPRDIAYFVALLMILNPKFTYESLLNSVVFDKNGKSMLEMRDLGLTYSINKDRAKAQKTECLDELSTEIIQTLIKCNNKRSNLIEKYVSKRLFLCINHKRTGLVAPTYNRVSGHLTGYDSRGNKNGIYTGICLSNHFPSLLGIGLGPNTISHSKIRATEGVLEWFRTGSVRSASRKLGNSHKVAIEHYIPKELISAYSTRMVRRFQNLLVIAASYNEDYLLEAVDFHSLEEIHLFIESILTVDKKATSPLISYLKNISESDFDSEHYFDSNLVVSISSSALTALYLYRMSALRSNVDATTLAIIEPNSGISPLSLISLASYLMSTLPNDSDLNLRESNSQAIEHSKLLFSEIKWENIFIKRESLV